MLRNAVHFRRQLLQQRAFATLQASQRFNQRQNQQQERNWNALYLTGAPVLLYLLAKSKQENLCEEPSRQDKIRGTYENKIRFFSPPEKIFETFASQKNEDGSLVMTYNDFFKALTPYNYTEMKDMKEYFEKH